MAFEQSEYKPERLQVISDDPFVLSWLNHTKQATPEQRASLDEWRHRCSLDELTDLVMKLGNDSTTHLMVRGAYAGIFDAVIGSIDRKNKELVGSEGFQELGLLRLMMDFEGIHYLNGHPDVGYTRVDGDILEVFGAALTEEGSPIRGTDTGIRYGGDEFVIAGAARLDTDTVRVTRRVATSSLAAYMRHAQGRIPLGAFGLVARSHVAPVDDVDMASFVAECDPKEGTGRSRRMNCKRLPPGAQLHRVYSDDKNVLGRSGYLTGTNEGGYFVAMGSEEMSEVLRDPTFNLASVRGCRIFEPREIPQSFALQRSPVLTGLHSARRRTRLDRFGDRF
jgi:hypothetical protein